MLQYIVILLDDKSVSYCHYKNSKSDSKLISLEDLKSGILYAMKRNLMVQFVYPDYDIPSEYKNMIETIDHCKIVPSGYLGKAEVIVFEDWDLLSSYTYNLDMICILKTSKVDLFEKYKILNEVIAKAARWNVILTDVETFVQRDFETYEAVLNNLIFQLKNHYRDGLSPQLNLLTDRIMLDKMNNCNAGLNNITLAPNGQFYICPAFYHTDSSIAIGNLKIGRDMKNPQLYRLDHAPLCLNCDAYQCKRCIWLNKKTTLEVNVPSHEQCVVAHLERNASRYLLSEIRQFSRFLPEVEISSISYLDPFDIKESFN